MMLRGYLYRKLKEKSEKALKETREHMEKLEEQDKPRKKLEKYFQEYITKKQEKPFNFLLRNGFPICPFCNKDFKNKDSVFIHLTKSLDHDRKYYKDYRDVDVRGFDIKSKIPLRITTYTYAHYLTDDPKEFYKVKIGNDIEGKFKIDDKELENEIKLFISTVIIKAKTLDELIKFKKRF